MYRVNVHGNTVKVGMASIHQLTMQTYIDVKDIIVT